MVKTVLSLTLLGTLLTTSAAQAATADSVRTSLMTATGLIADAVEPSPVRGIWEVQIQGRIFYVDDEAKYVLAGANIIETATQKNLTNERLREMRARIGRSGRSRTPSSRSTGRASARSSSFRMPTASTAARWKTFGNRSAI